MTDKRVDNNDCVTTMQLKLPQPPCQTSQKQSRSREKETQGKPHAFQEVVAPSSASSSSACSLNTFNMTMQWQSPAVSFGLASEYAANPPADWAGGADCTHDTVNGEPYDCDAHLGNFHLPSLEELLDASEQEVAAG